MWCFKIHLTSGKTQHINLILNVDHHLKFFCGNYISCLRCGPNGKQNIIFEPRFNPTGPLAGRQSPNNRPTIARANNRCSDDMWYGNHRALALMPSPSPSLDSQAGHAGHWDLVRWFGHVWIWPPTVYVAWSSPITCWHTIYHSCILHAPETQK